MTNEQRESLRNRRRLAPVPVCKSVQLFTLLDGNATNGMRRLILDWIAVYTTGEFYLGSNVLYFCDEKDAMSYKLYDVTAKSKELNEIRKEQQKYAKRI